MEELKTVAPQEEAEVEVAVQDSVEFDDVAEQEKAERARAEKIEQDKLLPPDPDALLEIRHLKKHFVLKKTLMGKPISTLKAVEEVSFKIKYGETLVIVG